MRHSRKVDAYREVVALLKVHPILTWACQTAGISRQAVYKRMASDDNYRREIQQAKAVGQEPLLAKCSPERILTWSDPETFSNRQTIEHERGCEVVIQVSDKLRDRLAG
jgi:hypothetical protein